VKNVCQWVGGEKNARREVHEVERALSRSTSCGLILQNYLVAMISRSSISNTNVAPGLIKGGKPLSR
jgi:hypothetical protein